MCDVRCRVCGTLLCTEGEVLAGHERCTSMVIYMSNPPSWMSEEFAGEPTLATTATAPSSAITKSSTFGANDGTASSQIPAPTTSVAAETAAAAITMTSSSNASRSLASAHPASSPERVSSSLQRQNGRITCPSCDSKLGSWQWRAAECIQCGQWVAPCFRLATSRVDRGRPR